MRVPVGLRVRASGARSPDSGGNRVPCRSRRVRGPRSAVWCPAPQPRRSTLRVVFPGVVKPSRSVVSASESSHTRRCRPSCSHGWFQPGEPQQVTGEGDTGRDLGFRRLYPLHPNVPATPGQLASFRWESSGRQDLLSRLQPRDVRDVIADISLLRPGPVSCRTRCVPRRSCPVVMISRRARAREFHRLSRAGRRGEAGNPLTAGSQVAPAAPAATGPVKSFPANGEPSLVSALRKGSPLSARTRLRPAQLEGVVGRGRPPDRGRAAGLAWPPSGMAVALRPANGKWIDLPSGGARVTFGW
nr:hypothetical protein [Streptomyces caeruleatus]